MNGKHYIGKRASSLELYDEIGPITGVALIVDDKNKCFAGDESGYVLTAECPYATDQMAADALAKVQGKTYLGYRSTDTVLPVDAELGDGVTVGGIYSMLAYRKVSFGPGHMSEISAPGENEVDHEYPYVSSTKRETDRKLAQTRSMISKTSKDVEILAEDYEKNIGQTLRVAADGVTITNADGSKLEIDGGQLKANSVTADRIDATNLKVAAANITGTLEIGVLPEAVATTDDIPTKTSELTNDSGFQTETGVTQIIGGTVTADYLYALGVSASYLRGEKISIEGKYGNEAGYMTVSDASTAAYAIDLLSKGALRLLSNYSTIYISNYFANLSLYGEDLIVSCSSLHPESSLNNYLGTSAYPWGAIFSKDGEIQQSDANLKNSIEDLPQKYIDFILWLSAKRFKLNEGNSGRYHVGFIAQDVETGMKMFGIDSLEFAGFVKDTDKDGNDIYMLRYNEFIAMLVAAVQAQQGTINDHEERLKKLEAMMNG